jgi:hypothetical protein
MSIVWICGRFAYSPHEPCAYDLDRYYRSSWPVLLVTPVCVFHGGPPHLAPCSAFVYPLHDLSKLFLHTLSVCSMARKKRVAGGDGATRSNPGRAARPGASSRPRDAADEDAPPARVVRGRKSTTTRPPRRRGSGSRGGRDNEDEEDTEVYEARRPASSRGIPCPPERPKSHAELLQLFTQKHIPDAELRAMILGRSIDPNVVPRTPERIGLTFSDRLLAYHKHYSPSPRRGQDGDDGTIPLMEVDYFNRPEVVEEQRRETVYKYRKDTGVESRFWSRFHMDFYNTVFYQDGKSSTSPRLFNHKALDPISLSPKRHPELGQLAKDLEDWKLMQLITFRHGWNREILYQFWSTLFIDNKRRILH